MNHLYCDISGGAVGTPPPARSVSTFGKRSEVPGSGQMVGLEPARGLGSEFDHRSTGVAKVELIAGYERC